MQYEFRITDMRSYLFPIMIYLVVHFHLIKPPGFRTSLKFRLARSPSLLNVCSSGLGLRDLSSEIRDLNLSCDFSTWLLRSDDLYALKLEITEPAILKTTGHLLVLDVLASFGTPGRLRVWVSKQRGIEELAKRGSARNALLASHSLDHQFT